MAGGKASTFENDLLKLIFNGTPIGNIADNASVSPLTNLFVSLHTADPGATGNQTTNEATYAGYARVAVARTSAAWAVSGNAVTPVSAITFPTSSSGGSETEAFFAVGTTPTGAGKILYRGTVTANILVTFGTVPQLGPATTITES